MRLYAILTLAGRYSEIGLYKARAYFARIIYNLEYILQRAQTGSICLGFHFLFMKIKRMGI